MPVKPLNMAAILAAARKKKTEPIHQHQSTNPPQVIAPTKQVTLSAIDLLRAKLASKKKGETVFLSELPKLRGLRADLVIVDDIDTSKEVGCSFCDFTGISCTGDTCSYCGYSEEEEVEPSTNQQTTGMSGEAITYNQQQQVFIDSAGTGKSCVLIGAAGTGKTTCSQGGIQALIQSGKPPVLDAMDHRHLKSGGPGILITSFTRRAVNNIRKVQSEDMKPNCITVHKLLEYAPEYFEIFDLETGLDKKTMRFTPSRNSSNPLPSSIHTIIVEEASMLSVDLFTELLEALTHPVQWIFIGDIQQLPPVFGAAILGFKMLELPVIELTTVYRQALESPIIRLAHRVLSGEPIDSSDYESWYVENQLKIHLFKKKLSADNAALVLSAFFKAAIDKGEYLPEDDMILIPYNKACGTLEINAQIANHLARKREAVTYEIMAGFNKHYFSVGDKILYDREDAEIIEINRNPAYAGGKIQPESKYLDYWGYNPKFAEEQAARNTSSTGFSTIDNGSSYDVDMMLEAIADQEDRVTQASHTIVVRLADTASEVSISKAAEVNGLLHAYALTVHKAQGSEWRKVFLCFHQSHATMLQRELLYTAITRAREELYIICEPETFTKGIISQRITGETLAEKAEYFKGKITEEGAAKYRAKMLESRGD